MTQPHPDRRSLLIATASAALLAACGGGDDDIPTVQSATVQDEGPIFRTLSVQLSAPADVEVEYQTANGQRLRVRTRAANRSQHEVLLPRLRAQSTYIWRIRVWPELNTEFRAGGQFTTGALPAALAAISFTPSGRFTAPMTFLSMRSGYTGGVIIDQDGQVVWYGATTTAVQGATRRANGNWVIISGYGLEEFDARGRQVASLSHSALPAPLSGIHHGVTETADGRLLFLALVPRLIGGTTLRGEDLLLWNGGTSTPTKVWSAFDHLDPNVFFGPRSVPTDWLHANHVSIGAAGQVYVSMHFINEVIALAPDFATIRWHLGGPQSTFALTAEQQFTGQHSAQETAPGRILLFDNGSSRADGSRWSRAIEFELDPVARSARTVWQYRPSPDIYAGAISSTRRLANGNTLVTFGMPAGLNNSSGPIVIHEVDVGGRLLGTMQVDAAVLTSVFQGDAVSSIAGEVLVG